ncbi:LemA family protein [Candidatus Dojkabacteria bacterium]|nr:LemA family protein [Candidatus Dojkabacteria bacterium]
MEILLVCLAVVGVLVLGVLGYIFMLYNGLVRLRVLVEEAWSGIDVQLKKRYDLIPNLVETVKGYAKHEKGTFEKVAELRTRAMGTNDPEELGKIEGEMRSTLKTLFAVAESYPELKADQNFLNLQNTLKEIETEIESARRYYNGAVRDYNMKIQVFPANMVAGMLGFNSKKFFESSEEERKNVKVSFTDEEEK